MTDSSHDGLRPPGEHSPHPQGGYAAPGSPAGGPPQGGYAVPPDASVGGGPQPGQWSAPMQVKPGIVPLRPLTLGDIYGGVIAAIRGNVQATIGAGLLVSVAVLAVLVPIGLWVQSQETILDLDDPAASSLGLGIGENVPTLATLIVPPILAAFLAYVVTRAVLGRKVTLAETWQATWRRLPAVLANVFLAFLAILIVMAAVIAPTVYGIVQVGEGDPGFGGIAAMVGAIVALVLLVLAVVLFLSTRWAFAVPAIVVERIGPFAAFRRSWGLTSGRQFWRILGLRLLTALLINVITYFLTFPLVLLGLAVFVATGFDPERMAQVTLVMNAVSVLVVGALTTPFTAGVDALLYTDQRIRREALDVTLIQATSGGRAG